MVPSMSSTTADGRRLPAGAATPLPRRAFFAVGSSPAVQGGVDGGVAGAGTIRRVRL